MLGPDKFLINIHWQSRKLKEKIKIQPKKDCFKSTFFLLGGLIPILGDKEIKA